MWIGSFLKKNYETLVAEIKDLISGSPVWTIIPDHIDDLKRGVQGVELSFNGTGGPQKVPHGLGKAPRQVCIKSFKAPRGSSVDPLPTEIVITAVDASDITVVTQPDTAVTLVAWPALRFPFG